MAEISMFKCGFACILLKPEAPTNGHVMQGTKCDIQRLAAENCGLANAHFPRDLQRNVLELGLQGVIGWQQFLSEGLQSRSIRTFQACFQ